MAEIIRSGAFLQQCWSVHPLCLTVKRVEPERIVVLTCSSCRMVHRVTTGAITRQASAVDSSSPESGLVQPDGLVALKTCLGTHAPALSVREMDVFQDAVWVRCAECRAQYPVEDVAHSKSLRRGKVGREPEVDIVAKRIDLVLRQKREQGWSPATSDDDFV